MLPTNCIYWQWFCEVFLSPCSDILYTFMSGFNAGPPEVSKVMGIQCWFSALPLMYRDFSRFCEPLDDIVGHIEKRSWTVRSFLTQLLTKWCTSPHPCLWMTEPLRDVLFIPNHSTKLWSINLFTCGMFQTGVFWAFLNFSSLLLPLSQLFWNVLQTSNSKWVNICKKTIKLISLNIKYLVFVVFLNWI